MSVPAPAQSATGCKDFSGSLAILRSWNSALNISFPVLTGQSGKETRIAVNIDETNSQMSSANNACVMPCCVSGALKGHPAGNGLVSDIPSYRNHPAQKPESHLHTFIKTRSRVDFLTVRKNNLSINSITTYARFSCRRQDGKKNGLTCQHRRNDHPRVIVCRVLYSPCSFRHLVTAKAGIRRNLRLKDGPSEGTWTHCVWFSFPSGEPPRARWNS